MKVVTILHRARYRYRERVLTSRPAADWPRSSAVARMRS